MLYKKGINFLVSPYWTLSFFGKKIAKFCEVALVYVRYKFLIGCIAIAREYQPWNTVNTIADICLLVKNGNQNTETKCKICSNFFFSHLAALKPTLGHWKGGILTHPMLIPTLFQVWPEDYRESRNEVRSQSTSVGFESETFRFWSVSVLSNCVILPESVLETIYHSLASFFSWNYRSFSLSLNSFHTLSSVAILTLNR